MNMSPNFKRSEFACSCGCGFDTPDWELVELLEKIRAQFAAPVKITSSCRCPAHNKAVGGKASSQHLKGRAADIQVKGVDPLEVQNYCASVGVRGLGSYSTFTHVDTRATLAAWGG